MANSEIRENISGNNNVRRPRQNPQNYRPSYARGRGRVDRQDPHVAKALYNFGVTDLRQFLDKKHQETQSQAGPPPDPSYNFLKDPLRDNVRDEVNDKIEKSRKNWYDHESQMSRMRSKSTERRPEIQRHNIRSKSSDRRSESDKPTFIHNPKNIKVELRTSTGERNLKIDQDKILANIRHVPDHELADQSQSPRGRGRVNLDRRGSWRGRGLPQRGRGGEMRGRGRLVKESNNVGDVPNVQPVGAENVEEARGRGNFRGRRGNFRGRNQRGNRGRGQNYTRGRGQKQNSVSAPEIQSTAEECWDDVVSAQTLNQDSESNTEHESENYESSYEENDLSNLNNENDYKNVVVTYPSREEPTKRTVKFDIHESNDNEKNENVETQTKKENLNHLQNPENKLDTINDENKKDPTNCAN